MKVHRTLRGLAVFRVNKDYPVTLIDLNLVGFKLSGNSSVQRYRSYFNIIDDLISSLKLEQESFVRNLVLYYRNKPVLCKIYYSKNTIYVKYIVISAFQSGIIRKIAGLLEKMDWKKIFLLEIATTRTSPAYRRS
ncbi:MAG TPA: hypothetical protein ENG40_03480 [Thermoprotei archaeon]|nr:hypothetical protein [Thermoprotei archaeon]